MSSRLGVSGPSFGGMGGGVGGMTGSMGGGMGGGMGLELDDLGHMGNMGIMGQMGQQMQPMQQQLAGGRLGPGSLASTTGSINNSNSNFGSSGATGKAAAAVVDEDDIPLLEELGIDFREIALKTVAMLLPFRLSAAAAGKSTFTVLPAEPLPGSANADPQQQQQQDGSTGPGGGGADLAGPLVFCLLLGTFLLLAGKVHFGYIYGFGITGCALLWLMLNLMCDAALTLDQTMHVLGYCLAPIVALAGLAVAVSLKGSLGHAVALAAVGWATATATRCFEASLGMREQRYLIAYPVALLYSCFALLAVF